MLSRELVTRDLGSCATHSCDLSAGTDILATFYESSVRYVYHHIPNRFGVPRAIKRDAWFRIAMQINLGSSILGVRGLPLYRGYKPSSSRNLTTTDLAGKWDSACQGMTRSHVDEVSHRATSWVNVNLLSWDQIGK